jgi:hypothetical protein
MDMALKCTAVVKDLAYLSFRLPFGGRPCPSLWSDFLETITVLSTAIALDESWDPETLHSPLQDLIPETESVSDDTPFAQALPQSVRIPVTDGAYKADVFIDDGHGCHRGVAASLLAIHAVCRPVSPSEPVPRDELTADKKLIAKKSLLPSRGQDNVGLGP